MILLLESSISEAMKILVDENMVVFRNPDSRRKITQLNIKWGGQQDTC